MSDLITVEQPGKLTPVYSPQDLFKLKKDLDNIIRENLVDNVDYGVIPGTRGKPSLWKSGAEKIAIAFGLKPDYEIVDTTIDHTIELTYTKQQWNDKTRRKEATTGTALGLYRYVIKCNLRNHSGHFLGSGMGICSSLETKYADRPRDSENTINKMAQKRAFVAAILNSLGLSTVFTQDVEDQMDLSKKEESAARPVQQGFDPGIKAHQDWFMKAMEKEAVDFDKWDDYAQKLKGTPRETLSVRLSEILGKDAGHIGAHA